MIIFCFLFSFIKSVTILNNNLKESRLTVDNYILKHTNGGYELSLFLKKKISVNETVSENPKDSKFNS